MLGSIDSVRYSREYTETCVRRHIIKRLIVTLTVATLATLAGAQGDPITPEQFAQENPDPAFEMQGGEFSPANMLELAYQCLNPVAQEVNDNLVVTGFDMVDARAYRARGVRSLQTALRRAELNAKAQAVEVFEQVRVTSQERMQDTEQESTQSVEGSDGDFVSQFSAQTTQTLSTMTESSVEGFLVGGRTTGTKVISLGDEGMCVGVRYELPLDQSNYDPAERVRETSAQQAAPAQTEASEEREGFDPPPPGEIGDW